MYSSDRSAGHPPAFWSRDGSRSILARRSRVHRVRSGAPLFGLSSTLGLVGGGSSVRLEYILFVSAFPVLYAITVLEEHELIERFGEEYRRYQREVPRLISRWQKTS